MDNALGHMAFLIYFQLIVQSYLQVLFIVPHRQILKMAGRLEESQRILDNNPAAGLARAVAKAWELYGSER